MRRLVDDVMTIRGGPHPAAGCPPCSPEDVTADSRTLGSSGSGRPDPDAVLPVLARLVMEVLAGRRPLAQLEPMLSPAVATRLADRIRTQYRTDQVPSDRVQVRHATACWVSEQACEGVVTVEHVDRTTALAIRIEQHERCWRVVEAAGPEFAWRPIGPGRASTGDDHDLADVIDGPWDMEEAPAGAT